MDLMETHRETVAEITSAWRAAGYEPSTVYLNGDFVTVGVNKANGYRAVVQRGFGRWYAEINMQDLGAFDTLADAIGALVGPMRDGVLTRQRDNAWQAYALRPNAAWCTGTSRDEAITAALAVRA